MKAHSQEILMSTIALLIMSLFTTVAGCTARHAVTLNVSAAASLVDALKEVDSLYEENYDVAIIANLASSGTLQRQIENGAPADIFISAGTAQMDALQEQGLILDATRKDMVMNTIVVIVPADSNLGLASLEDLTSTRVEKVGIGDPKSVPAGTYAQLAFDELHIASQLQPKLILGGDARQVLSYVESGDVDAGIVYSTDARTSTRVRVVATAPDQINDKIVYPVAVIKASRRPDAAKTYETFLSSSRAKVVFEKYGFRTVS